MSKRIIPQFIITDIRGCPFKNGRECAYFENPAKRCSSLVICQPTQYPDDCPLEEVKNYQPQTIAQLAVLKGIEVDRETGKILNPEKLGISPHLEESYFDGTNYNPRSKRS